MARDAIAVVGDADRLQSGFPNVDPNPGSSCVDRVIDEFFDGCRRTLHDLARRNLQSDVLRENLNAGAHGCAFITASVIRHAWRVAVTSCVRMIRTPCITPQAATASDPGKRSLGELPSTSPMKPLRDAASKTG